MARTLGNLIAEARVMLQDTVAMNDTGQPYRYTDDELMQAINAALLEIRTKRPDAYVGMGLRNAVPQFSAATDMSVTFPLDPQFYTPVLYYCVGRTELREDTFSQDSRAVALMNKFVSQLLGVQS